MATLATLRNVTGVSGAEEVRGGRQAGGFPVHRPADQGALRKIDDEKKRNRVFTCVRVQIRIGKKPNGWIQIGLCIKIRIQIPSTFFQH